jgi:hypothetical protein
VSQEKLNLFQFAAGKVAQPRAGPSQIMRREFLNPRRPGCSFHNVPDCLRRNPDTQDFAGPVDLAKDVARPCSGRHRPSVNSRPYPGWYGDGSNVFSFADQVGIDPVILTLLKVVEFETRQFNSPQTAAEQGRQRGTVPLIAKCVGSPYLDQRTGLFGGQPVSDSHAQTFSAFYATDTSRQFGAEKSRIGGLIREPPHRSQAYIDGRRSKVLLFQEKPVPEDDGTIEGKTWFRAVPTDELIDCMSEGFLR